MICKNAWQCTTPGTSPTPPNMHHGISKRPLRSSIKKRPLLMNAISNPEQVGCTLQSIFSSPATAPPGCCFEVVKSRCLVRSNGFVFNNEKEGGFGKPTPTRALLAACPGESTRSPTAACHAIALATATTCRKTAERQQGKCGCSRLGNSFGYQFC